jgi:hypothetical protein
MLTENPYSRQWASTLFFQFCGLDNGVNLTLCLSRRPNAADPQHCRGCARPRQQVIVKFLDKSTGGGLASVVGVIQVTWYPSGQWSTERLDPT